jgi:hypothetical protein
MFFVIEQETNKADAIRMMYDMNLFRFIAFRLYGIGSYWRDRQGITVILETEDVSEVLQGATPDEATTILLCITIKPVVGVILEEQVQILVGSIVKSVLQ